MMQLIDPGPRSEEQTSTALASLTAVREAIVALLACMQSTLACADQCAAENLPALRRCIRLNLDCAAICTATTAVLSRSHDPDWRVIGAQLQTCIIACDAAAEECEHHTLEHTSCRVTADVCRTSERTCAWLVASVPVQVP